MAGMFGLLEAQQIDVRIGSISRNGEGVTLLLYKDARCDMEVLDKMVGASYWKRTHYELKGNIYCTVSIWGEKLEKNGMAEWIEKSDCGAESFTEKEKGESSDSFKRACVNFGIGRELYTAGRIWVNSSHVNIRDGKVYDKFKVTHIEYDGDCIKEIEIYNTTKKCIAYSSKANESSNKRSYNNTTNYTDAVEKHEKQASTSKYICKECGEQIKGTGNYTDEQTYKNYNGYCWKHKKKNNERNTNAEFYASKEGQKMEQYGAN